MRKWAMLIVLATRIASADEDPCCCEKPPSTVDPLFRDELIAATALFAVGHTIALATQVAVPSSRAYPAEGTPVAPSWPARKLEAITTGTFSGSPSRTAVRPAPTATVSARNRPGRLTDMVGSARGRSRTPSPCRQAT